MSASKNDIPKKLHEFISSRENMPFSWGKNDCCLFVADWILIITGNDCAADVRGKYSTRDGADAILNSRGGITAMLDVAAGREGWEKISPMFAQRGDIATIPGDDGLVSAGVVTGQGVVGVVKKGLRHVPLKAASAAWRVI